MLARSPSRRASARRRPAWLAAIPVLVFAAACSPSVDNVDDPGAAGAQDPDVVAVDAHDAVLAAFDDHQVVGGFSASHGNKEVDDFLLALIRDPRLPGVVDDIAIECGNARYQDVLDSYVAGDDVPLAALRPVWRDTTQGAICGTSTFYEQLIPLVREVNEDLPPDDQLRVVATDPPVDWTQVASMQDLEAFGERDEVIAEVIEREVLEKDRTALLLFGIHHVRHGTESAVGRYEANGYDGVTYVIADHFGFGNQSQLTPGNDELEARMADWPRPSIAPIEGTWLGELDSAQFNQDPGEQGFPGVDAYLYVGPRDTLLREPRSAQALLDQDYLAELERRAASIGEPDGPSSPGSIRELEATEGALLYDPQ